MPVLIDTSQLKKLAASLKATEPAVVKEFNKSLKAAGELIATDARARSSWSSRIPGSIRVRGATNIRITAGGAAAPDAAPYEHGGKSGTFRHPVFGNRQVWVSQQARPFLVPAGQANIEKAAGLIVDGLDAAFSRLGY